jgi:predicted solute-binding protein
MNKKTTRLDTLVDMHSSIVASPPAIVFFTNSSSVMGGFICSMIYLIGFVIAAYKNVLPVVVNTRIKWSEDNVRVMNLTTMNMGDPNSFTPNVLYKIILRQRWISHCLLLFETTIF